MLDIQECVEIVDWLVLEKFSLVKFTALYTNFYLLVEISYICDRF